LNAPQHRLSVTRQEPTSSSGSLGIACANLFSAFMNNLSYYDKNTAMRFYWHEAFASSKSRSSFLFAECERTNSFHPNRFIGVSQARVERRLLLKQLSTTKTEERPIGA